MEHNKTDHPDQITTEDFRATKSEADIKREIYQFLLLHGIFCWIQNQGGYAGEYKGKKRFIHFTRGVKGVSDILGCLPDGRFLAIEVKAAKGKLSVDQEKFLRKIHCMGGTAFVAHGITDVEEYLKTYW